MSKAAAWGLGVVAVTGVALVAGGLGLAWESWQFRERAHTVPAHVLGMDEDRRVRVQVDGQAPALVQPVDLPEDVGVGTRITVLVDPQAPGDVRVDGFVSLWMSPVALLFLGLVQVASCVLARVLLFPRRRPPPRVDERVREEALRILRQRGKLAAIRAVRERTGLGLAAAKDVVDGLE